MLQTAETFRHETLLNLAFAGVPAWWLCPYDTTTLGPAVLEEAWHSHPFVTEGGIGIGGATYRGLEQAAEPFAAPLPDPNGEPAALAFEVASLAELRSFPSGVVVRLHVHLP